MLLSTKLALLKPLQRTLTVICFEQLHILRTTSGQLSEKKVEQTRNIARNSSSIKRRVKKSLKQTASRLSKRLIGKPQPVHQEEQTRTVIPALIQYCPHSKQSSVYQGSQSTALDIEQKQHCAHTHRSWSCRSRWTHF